VPVVARVLEAPEPAAQVVSAHTMGAPEGRLPVENFPGGHSAQSVPLVAPTLPGPEPGAQDTMAAQYVLPPGE
jgi:hypothetical protein